MSRSAMERTVRISVYQQRKLLLFELALYVLENNLTFRTIQLYHPINPRKVQPSTSHIRAQQHRVRLLQEIEVDVGTFRLFYFTVEGEDGGAGLEGAEDLV